MKLELIQLLTERIELLNRDEKVGAGKKEDVTYVVADSEDGQAPEQQNEVESVLVDFDYDSNDEENFNLYIDLRFKWNDWNPVYTDIFRINLDSFYAWSFRTQFFAYLWKYCQH